MSQADKTPKPEQGEEIEVQVRDLRHSAREDDEEENGAEAETAEAEAVDLEEKIAALEDQNLRLRAELDNYRKRTEREMASFRKYANESLIKELLPQIDNLERALDHGRETNPDDPLLEGVELILKGLVDALAKFGVSRVEAVGQAFDPNLHEAIMQQEDAEAEDNTVLAEHQKGYLLHDRLLRPAMVVVSKRPDGDDQP